MAEKIEAIEKRNMQGETTDGVSLELTIATATDYFASRMELAINVANHRADEVEFFYADGAELDLRAFDEAGAPVALTDRGEQVVARNWPWRYSITRQILRTVAPGAKQQWNIDIAPLFRFAPGKNYTLSAEIRLLKPAQTRIAVQDLSFTVR